MTTADHTHVDHLIVGAGFGGLCAAIKLEEDGERDFVVIEKGSGVGGTWRDNTYPGAACDVPSQLYSYSFALNPDWSMSFSPQPEIEAYIRGVAEGSGTLDRFVFDTAMTSATWDETQQRWLVETEGKAGKKTYAATTVIAGPGALSEPRLPEIEGIEDFQGEIFHSAKWNHDADLTGKRVAVIGTGASSIQIVPELQERVAHLDVYQRTAPWVIPRNEHRYTKAEKLAFRHIPGVQKLARTAIYWGREAYVPAFAWKPKLAAPAKAMAKLNIRRGIKDPELRRKVTPDYEIGCKRILISNRYYPALDADNVDLITDGIAKVTGSSIVAKDGTEREIDVLVVATGFYTTDLPIAHSVVGSKGRTMSERFAETGMSAYKGTTIPEFPNLFFVVGPNTGLGHSSMVFIIESQVAYIRDAIRTMRTNAYATVEPTEDATSAWNDDLQRKMGPSVWSQGGCASWYLDEHGRNTTLWPSFTFLFRHLTSTFDVDKYVVTAANGQQADKTQESVSA
ncbi:cation diffusion facilitator CzcD-associated flavoprotein CzcO [Nocardioides albertanoniae]|uniref:Cation diffusion facilitator CzcD-associated flavoprotein CzcO n=1 Tax=Nocardioides albertanoniae TaxID=1175486 RepID=A0A543ACF0_9ACTN|nr:NAD(P)/FAD-dependent oxidoreductase [Nocardioides albertanoniae]TQL70258.1 cation diffusion facilitator CzcD-associated flavoprotein CzcO [Nocardioides albertanoniae]